MKPWARLDRNWILVAALTVFAIAPLTYPGFFQPHTGFLPAYNVEHLSDAPDWGRTPDPLRGEGKLPYLLAWPFFKLSGSGVVAIKWGYGLAFLLSALGTYAWTRRWLGKRGGVLAAVVYTYLPWHLGTVYVRGAYAEACLWAFWPLVLWALDHMRERRFLAAILAGLPALLASLWTQPGLSALAIPLLVAYGIVVTIKRRTRVWLLLGMAVLALVALWFLGRTAPQAPLPFADHFPYPFQLLSAAWGFGISVPGWADDLSFQLGLAAVGLTVVAVALWLSKGDGGSEEQSPAPPNLLGRVFWFWAAVALGLIFLTLSWSLFIWDITNLRHFLIYPWQVLALAALPLAFLAGSAARLDKRMAEWPVWAGLLALVILASYPYLAPRFTRVDPGPEPVAMFQPTGAEAPQIMIVDTAIAPPTAITPTLTLTVTWQAASPVTGDYTVFVHVLNPDGAKAAQQDTRPCAGECPTHSWQPGEIIADRYQLTLPADAPPGPYRLAVGLYLLETGERVTVVGRDDETVFFDVP